MMKSILASLFCAILMLLSCEERTDRPQSAEADREQAIKKVANTFANKTISVWHNSKSYELLIYGETAYIRSLSYPTSMLHYPISADKFRVIWNDFHALPNLETYRNEDSNVTQGKLTHHIVFLNDSAGLVLPPGRYSYSIPNDVAVSSYSSWYASVKLLIDEYESHIQTVIKKQTEQGSVH